MEEAGMGRRGQVVVSTAGVTAAITASIASMPRIAGATPLGGGTISARAILVKSFRAINAHSGYHAKGYLRIASRSIVPGKTGGYREVVLFHSDFTRAGNSVRSRGQASALINVPGRHRRIVKRYRLVRVGTQTAAKIGRKPWTCHAAGSATLFPIVLGSGNVFRVSSLSRLPKTAAYAPGSYRGVAVWIVVVTGRSQGTGLPYVVKFWIRRSDLLPIAFADREVGRGSNGQAFQGFVFREHLSRFGEVKPISLPAACSG
jgi:hypothetical protein